MNQENNAQDLLEEIRALMFSVNDLSLYLDTHPCDMKAINSHRQYNEKLRELMNIYQTQYAPLSIYQPVGNWEKWVNSPWPWERGGM